MKQGDKRTPAIQDEVANAQCPSLEARGRPHPQAEGHQERHVSITHISQLVLWFE